MYNDVNNTLLKNEINASLKELSSYSLNNVLNSLNAAEVLTEEVKKTVVNSIKCIMNEKSLNGSIEKLRSYLSNLENVSENIKIYQKQKADIEEFEENMDDEKSSHRRKLRKMKKELQKTKEVLDKLLE